MLTHTESSLAKQADAMAATGSAAKKRITKHA
jgi:hypothetical protein